MAENNLKYGTRFSFDYMGRRHIGFVFSIVLSVLSIFDLAYNGLNLGVDFTGGTVVEVGYQEPVELNAIRGTLRNTVFSDAILQYFGSARDVMIRIPSREGMNNSEISDQLLELLRQSGQAVEPRRVEYVGPQVGEELAESGGLAMLAALAMILLYVAFRFQMRFAVGAIVCTVHDVIVTFGFFALTGMEFDLTVLAAILAVIGYSLNDTIVVFDRIRENFHRLRKKEPAEVINISINQTLSRTIMTSGTTLLVLVALFFYGGETIHGFATALIVGIVIGTYSSIFVASPVTLVLGVSRKDLMPVEKEGVAKDALP